MTADDSKFRCFMEAFQRGDMEEAEKIYRKLLGIGSMPDIAIVSAAKLFSKKMELHSLVAGILQIYSVAGILTVIRR